MEEKQELLLYKKLEESTQTGWYKVDLNRRLFTYSDFMKELLGNNSNHIPIDDFYSYIRSDYREKLRREFPSSKTVYREFNEFTYPIISPNKGEIWLHSKQNIHTMDEETGGDLLFGIVKVVDNPENEIGENDENSSKANELLLRLNSLSLSLFNFLRYNTENDVITPILENVRQTINGDRAYIIEFTNFNNLQSCTYEANADGANAQKDILQEIPSDIVPWWTRTILDNKPIILDSLSQIPNESKEEYHILSKQNIKSLICVPMYNGHNVWGYFGIDMVKHSHKWTKEDYQWITAIGNFICICMELSNTKHNAANEDLFLRNLIKYMPLGFAHISLIRNEQGVPVDYKMVDYNDHLKNNILKDMCVTPRNQLGSKCQSSTFFKNIIKDNIKVDKCGMLEEDEYLPQNHKNLHKICYSPTKNQIVYLYIDTTDILKNRNQIIDFETFFSLISDFAKIGYGKFNKLTSEGYANRQWKINLGENENTPIKDIINYYSKLYPEDRQCVLDFYNDAINGVRKNFTREVRVKVNDKEQTEWKWIRMNIIVTKYEPSKNNIEFVGVNYDINESKNTENELIRARNKAQSMDKLKSAFLANMSHEIRTPLNAIVGFSEILSETSTTEEREESLKIIRENNELLLQLISDILDLSKIEAGTFEFNISDIDIYQLFSDIARTSQMKVKTNVKIICDNSQDNVHIRSDRNRLHQVVGNFVNNAIKFTSKGSIHIGYRINHDNMLYAYCKDDGIGITKEDQQHIFERFVKLNSFVKGTGLGLAICQSIINQLHGEIGVQSEVGAGSTFWFTIPVEN